VNHLDFDQHQMVRQHNEELLREVRVLRLGAAAKEQPGAFGTISHPQLDLAECARCCAEWASRNSPSPGRKDTK
jgi:hypothetical protein